MLIPSTYAPFISSFVVSPFFGIVTVRSTWSAALDQHGPTAPKTAATQLHGSSDGLVATEDAEAHG